MEYCADEEVEVGVAFELKDEGEREESEDVVLGSGDVVALLLAPWMRDLHLKL